MICWRRKETIVQIIFCVSLKNMAHFKGHFNTNYWAKFQIYAMIFSLSNSMVSKLCFVWKWLKYEVSCHTKMANPARKMASAWDSEPYQQSRNIKEALVRCFRLFDEAELTLRASAKVVSWILSTICVYPIS